MVAPAVLPVCCCGANCACTHSTCKSSLSLSLTLSLTPSLSLSHTFSLAISSLFLLSLFHTLSLSPPLFLSFPLTLPLAISSLSLSHSPTHSLPLAPPTTPDSPTTHRLGWPHTGLWACVSVCDKELPRCQGAPAAALSHLALLHHKRVETLQGYTVN